MSKGYVLLDDNNFVKISTTAGITASTTQTQGEGALTSQVNEVSTVANDNDTVTLPAAVPGREICIINNGANTLQIFPDSGDNLGKGVDVSATLATNEVVHYTAHDASNWKTHTSTEIIHAQMHDFSNTDAFIINAQNDQHMYHTNGMVAGDLSGWTFDAGGAGASIAIASIADGGGGEIAVTTGSAHNLAVGDIISQTDTGDVNYDKTFIVNTITSSTIYKVTATFGATATGTMDQAAVLIADIGSAGQYLMLWSASATSASNNETFDFAIHVGAIHQDSTNSRRKFGTAGDVGNMFGTSLITIADGDKVSFMITNNDSAGNITLRNLTLIVTRL